MRYIVIAMGCLVLLFLFLLKKKQLGTLLEFLAVFWFKVAVAVILLFVGNIILSSYGFVVPINLFSILTLALLGLPGVVCIGILILIK